mmetsp:Transcript_7561/g.10223  ORF Transcript_7561/g.10223 Transcript_7561/m.10223 type:complete len:540 (-) Transcript_7561:126-1745(-)|eukprot:CAMPEP_0196580376 /NCGR_PEP_ID=MMETSP1081-20130531/28586_1 /TAXON_ID=36882 /ORGANISM="Pyramimonas amylifera, Strain CCMP720" /LENGTH=539 /DNA_ID=CAMNT_0041900227 /DNA_START=138 /DNA_END=1757 /DNA_ORIENTATION=-
MEDDPAPPQLFSTAARRKNQSKTQIFNSFKSIHTGPSFKSEDEFFSESTVRSCGKEIKQRKLEAIDNETDTVEGPTSVAVTETSDGRSSRIFETFNELGLTEWLVGNCKSLGMSRPTPVQCHCVPQVLKGLDVMGTAETGSGKTAAFALPILQALAEDPYGIFALVLTPTRELASQIVDQFRALGSGLTLKEQVVIGGVDMTEQARMLCKRPHVVVATPGRLLAHFESDPRVVKAMGKLRFLVLDEADRLLDKCFEAELRVLLQSLPKSRQTLLFSATLTSSIKQLQTLSMKHAYHFLEYDGVRTVQSEQLKQEYVFIPAKVKEVYLAHILDNMEERWGVRSAIIFVATCHACQRLSTMMAELGVPHSALHAAKNQLQRNAALDSFRGSMTHILVATDVAARGLDIPSVDLVVNYDLPRVARDYVHRAGRTARAGRSGRCLAFVTQYDVDQLHRIEEVTERPLEECKLDEKEVLKKMTEVFKAKRSATMKMSEIGGFDEKLEARRNLKLERRKANKLNKECYHAKEPIEAPNPKQAKLL